jgi:hypothetical protein
MSAQTQTSSDFYFQKAQPDKVEEISQIIGEIVGEYTREEDRSVVLIVARDSVYCRYPVVMFLSVAEVDSSEKYEIRKNKIYGVHEAQGLPVQIMDDTAVFVHYAHELIFAPKISGVMKKHNGVYYFNYLQENDLYTTIALSLGEEELFLHSLDHSLVMPKIRNFSSLEEVKLDGVTTYIASPSNEEMIAFYEDKGFKDKIKYIRKSD